jgi:hypothetical protein
MHRLGTLWAYDRPDQVTFIAAMSSLTYIRTWTFFASTPGIARPLQAVSLQSRAILASSYSRISCCSPRRCAFC